MVSTRSGRSTKDAEADKLHMTAPLPSPVMVEGPVNSKACSSPVTAARDGVDQPVIVSPINLVSPDQQTFNLVYPAHVTGGQDMAAMLSPCTMAKTPRQREVEELSRVPLPDELANPLIEASAEPTLMQQCPSSPPAPAIKPQRSSSSPAADPRSLIALMLPLLLLASVALGGTWVALCEGTYHLRGLPPQLQAAAAPTCTRLDTTMAFARFHAQHAYMNAAQRGDLMVSYAGKRAQEAVEAGKKAAASVKTDARALLDRTAQKITQLRNKVVPSQQQQAAPVVTFHALLSAASFRSVLTKMDGWDEHVVDFFAVSM